MTLSEFRTLLAVPAEPVRRVWLGWAKSKTLREFLFGTLQAQEVAGTATIVAPDGTKGTLDVIFPVCYVHRVALFHFEVDPVQCPVTITWDSAPQALVG